MSKSAKEMFEELGYKHKYECIPYTNCESIEYIKENQTLCFLYDGTRK